MDDMIVKIDELVVDGSEFMADGSTASRLLSGVRTPLDAPVAEQVSRAIAASLSQLTPGALPP